MDEILLTNTPILPKLSIKTDHTITTTDSSQTSISEENYTRQPSVQNNETSSDSNSTPMDQSLSEDSEPEDIVNTPTKHVRFDLPKPKIGISLTLENDEAEFFAVVSSEDTKNNTNKPMRNRDKIRSAFNKKFHRSNNDTSDTNTVEWNELLVKTLASMHHDVQEIVAGFDRIEQPITDDSLSNRSESIITKPHLSLLERQREKLEMMRLAKMLHPPNLLTCNPKESPYPYTDITEPQNFNLFSVTKQTPFENLFIQHRPFRHKKFRYRIQRALLKISHNLKKLRCYLYGKTSKTYQELPSLDIQNYRNRLEKTLLEVRTQIAEYDRIHASTNDHRQSISQIIEKMNAIDATAQAQMDDYRAKLRPIEYIKKHQRNELVSAPFIPRRTPYRHNNIKKDKKKDDIIDTRFDPNTFIDLNKEAENFFGCDIPFWNRPIDSRLSLSSPTLRRHSNHFILQSKLGVWDRFILSFKDKQKNLRDAESKENHNADLFNESDEDDDEYFDCTSLLQQRKLQLLSFSNNEPSPISNNGHDPVDF